MASIFLEHYFFLESVNQTNVNRLRRIPDALRDFHMLELRPDLQERFPRIETGFFNEILLHKLTGAHVTGVTKLFDIDEGSYPYQLVNTFNLANQSGF